MLDAEDQATDTSIQYVELLNLGVSNEGLALAVI